jgi:hypothetical protein
VRRWLALAALAASLPGCTSTPESEPAWRSVEVDAPSDRVLWQLTLLSLQNLGYPLGAGLDRSGGIVTTGWKTDLHPFSGQGQRTRAEVRLAPVERGRWNVRARVERETNENMTDPLNAARAQWQAGPDDERTADILLMHIRARLDPELELAPAQARSSEGAQRPR